MFSSDWPNAAKTNAERIQRCNIVAFECSQISRETWRQRDTRWTYSTVMSSVHQNTHTQQKHTLAASVSVYTCYPTPHTHSCGKGKVSHLSPKCPSAHAFPQTHNKPSVYRSLLEGSCWMLGLVGAIFLQLLITLFSPDFTRRAADSGTGSIEATPSVIPERSCPCLRALRRVQTGARPADAEIQRHANKVRGNPGTFVRSGGCPRGGNEGRNQCTRGAFTSRCAPRTQPLLPSVFVRIFQLFSCLSLPLISLSCRRNNATQL